MSRFGGYSPPRGPERWDRSRFEAASRGPPVMERDRYEEDHYSRPSHRDHSNDRYSRRSPPRYEEKDRYYYEEKERYGPPAPYRPQKGPGRYYDEDPEGGYEGAMVPSRGGERDLEIDIRRTSNAGRAPQRPARPTFVRRQSSLDTYDRKPMPRYGDRVREETIIIPTGPRRRSPPRYEREREYEDIRVAEPDYYGDEEFHGYREREISRVRRTGRDNEIVEEKREEIVERTFPKRGKTRMPMRLVNRRAVIELGYSFEEEVNITSYTKYALSDVETGGDINHSSSSRKGSYR